MHGSCNVNCNSQYFWHAHVKKKIFNYYLANQCNIAIAYVLLSLDYIYMVKGRYIFFIVDLKLRLWKTKCDFNNEYSITYQLIFITQLCNLQNRLIKWRNGFFHMLRNVCGYIHKFMYIVKNVAWSKVQITSRCLAKIIRSNEMHNYFDDKFIIKGENAHIYLFNWFLLNHLHTNYFKSH